MEVGFQNDSLRPIIGIVIESGPLLDVGNLKGCINAKIEIQLSLSAN